MFIFLQRRMRFKTLKPLKAYVHNYTAITVSHSNHHADYAGTRLFILPYSRAPPPPVLSVYPSLSFSAFFPVDRALGLLTQLELFAFLFPLSFPLTLSPFSSTEINCLSPRADSASLHLF